MYCLGSKDSKVETASAGPPSAQESVLKDNRAVRILSVPQEVTLAPGQTVKFEPSPFSEAGQHGHMIGLGGPQATVVGLKGKWNDADASFTADAASAFSAGAIKLKWGELEATSRVRVCPKPPFKVDFEDMKPDSTPPGWLNVINKTKVVDQNGNKVLQKLAEKPSPPFMRIRAFMGPPIAGGYTVTADVMSTVRKTAVKEYWADAGVINSRYEMLLMGDTPATPCLRVVTWAPIPRLQKDVPLAWKPGIWYRVKFQVKLDGGKALLRGKVWARDELEPADWLIEAVDPYPNLEGSPGLYGYSNGTTEKSKGAEIFYDNIEVSGNE
ncbi:MAG: hypothetical protein HZB38_08300 [Planctomycetes bacterium]|nr:hypothetical protein [Planctomycetota bacterium]